MHTTTVQPHLETLLACMADATANKLVALSCQIFKHTEQKLAQVSSFSRFLSLNCPQVIEVHFPPKISQGSAAAALSLKSQGLCHAIHTQPFLVAGLPDPWGCIPVASSQILSS